MKNIYILCLILIVSVMAKAQCPSVTVSPITTTVTCNGAPKTFTAVFTPTTNVTAVWLGPGGSVVDVSNASPLLLQTSNPGTYTFMATNNTTSCTTTQTVAVVGISGISSMTIIPVSSGYTISCSHPSLVMQITSNGTLAPTGYTWTNVSTSISAMPATGAYTITTPGYYNAQFHDGNFCMVNQNIYVQIDTLRPIPTTSTSLVGNSYTLNCYTPTLTATVLSNPLLSSGSYSWVTPPNFVTSSNTINIGLINITSSTSPTTFTAIVQGSNGCINRIQVPFYKNITAPNATVTPASGTLTCNGPPLNFTAVANSTVNTLGQWYGPGGSPITSPIPGPSVINISSPGNYAFTATNVVSGCTVTQNASVSGGTGVPDIQICAPDYTISCYNPCTPMICCMTSGTLAPTGFTWTPLSSPSSSTTPPSGSYSACVPGQYVLTFHDGNFCTISQTVSIGIDTIKPSPLTMTNLSGNSYTLNCNTGSLVATAYSNPILGVGNYSWTVPPGTIVNSNTIGVTMANITSSTSPITYTVLATGANGCIGSTPVKFYKDSFVPFYSITASSSAITCSNPTVSLMPSGSSTVPVSFTFTSPPPTITSTQVPSTFSIAGTYTMSYQNQLNGCTGMTNTFVLANTTPPSTIAVGPNTIPCGTSSTNITAGTSSTSPYTFNWTGPAGSTMNNPNGYFTSADKPGTYTVQIIDITNGCSVNNYVSVNQTTVLSVPVSGSDTICIGYGTNLSVNVPAATNYSWSTGSTSNVIYVSPTVTTVYVISVTNTVSGCAGNNSFTVTVDACVGIKEIQKSINISLAPNPTNGKFNIVTDNYIEDAEIRIINMTGEEVYRQRIKQGINEVYIDPLAKGIYYYVVYRKNESIARGKLIIE